MICYTKFELQYIILILWEAFGSSISSFYYTKIRIKINFNKMHNYWLDTKSNEMWWNACWKTYKRCCYMFGWCLPLAKQPRIGDMMEDFEVFGCFGSYSVAVGGTNEWMECLGMEIRRKNKFGTVRWPAPLNIKGTALDNKPVPLIIKGAAFEIFQISRN